MLSESPIEKASFQNFMNGLEPIHSLIDDPSITEIMINSFESIWVEQRGVMSRTPIKLEKLKVNGGIRYLSSAVGNKEVRPGTPSGMVNAAHANMRIAAVMHPTAIDGDAMCIRKHSKSNFDADHYIQQGAFDKDLIAKELEKIGDEVEDFSDLQNKELLDFLGREIINKKNFLISGATNAGKTSFLNMLLKFIPDTQRIITIEDTEELKIVVPNRIRLLSNKSQGVTAQLLVELCMRMRPDRIIAGEVRGGEALDFVEALNTGHDGGFASLHARNALMTLARLESLAKRGVKGSEGAMTLREDIANCIEYVIHFRKSSASSNRFCGEIIKVDGLDGFGKYVTQKVF